LAGKVAPTYWVERKNADGRKEFLAEIVKKSKFGAPVLLFPEGYCANNTQVLQFRKAIFQDGVKIYPMAVKLKSPYSNNLCFEQAPPILVFRHDSRFGDAFWYENDFHSYVLRIMTSWATPYDVTYLAPMTRLPHETDTEFAARTQFAISDVVGVPASDFNGSMWYSKSEQRRVLEQQKAMCATALLSHLKDTAEKIDSEDGYFSLTTSASSSHCSSPTAISSMHY
uniref:PlsC domain-containing protein n=1 Tax=Heligmosomoides polygyrus TaxID=6339 RepID=A0A183F2Y3_HELPZ